jgi:hypothetical protein
MKSAAVFNQVTRILTKILTLFAITFLLDDDILVSNFGHHVSSANFL